MDVPAAIHWLERMPETVLIFDDCADFADSIGELAEECASSNVKLLVIGAERSRRRSFLQHKIEQKFLNLGSEHEYGLLSERDIESLVDKLASQRRLGHITRYPLSQQHAYFRSTASRRLFEGMASLEGGTGFRMRIRNAYHGINNDNLRRLYAACCVAYELGYPLPLGHLFKDIWAICEGFGDSTAERTGNITHRIKRSQTTPQNHCFSCC